MQLAMQMAMRAFPALLLVVLPACGALSLGAPVVLSKGTQPWGRWEHTDEQISIHIYLGDEGEELEQDCR